ncbi:FMN-binding protein [Clostridium frigoris]|uniref:FMN-binding protein n=1 Tax=Clostridium frigoris TaxID=205327 RepID=A0ABS6BPD7_9CLOT|nr:FMN-binding protein [Clostridium frigoris]MBU3158279.1 FMN-binding protein [Clostridium frigoris]
MTIVRKIVLVVICIMVLSGGLIGGKYLISVHKYKKIVSELKIGSVDLSKVSDGIYTGSCNAEFVAAKVSVTVKDHKIKDIILLSHKTERGKSAEVIPGNVVKAQNLHVDTITGATNSSKVILKSIEIALNAGKS